VRSKLSQLAREYEKRRLVQTLRRNPSWSLAEIIEIISRGDEVGRLLGSITIAELGTIVDSPVQLNDDVIQQVRRARAEQLDGPAFDDIVLEIVAEAWPPWVASTYVRARTGGPRWKVQASLGRLVRAGKLERKGATSGSRYRVPERGGAMS
jgi:hypothetical protein